LKQVVLHHVAHGAGGFVVAPAPFHAERLCRRDLNVIDIVTIPHGFERAVGELKSEEILHDLFTQKIIDAVDIILMEATSNVGVESARRCEVVPEWLLDDDARPASTGRFVSLTGEFRGAEALHDRRTQRRRSGEIKEPPPAGARAAINHLQPARQFRIAPQVTAVVFRRNVGQAGGEITPCLLVARSHLAHHRLSHPRAELVVGHLAARIPNHVELGREQTAPREAKHGGHDHSLRQVSGPAKEYERTRFHHAACFRPATRVRSSLTTFFVTAPLLSASDESLPRHASPAGSGAGR
jgi:hypothetical protein